MASPKIGFLGLGIMGRPMARSLMKAGFPVTVWNRTPARMDELAADGAVPADSPKRAAETCGITISMVSDTPDVEAVVLGEGGVIEGVRAGSVHIDMSTISPTAARRIAAALEAKGARMLDAPVSGGDIGAQRGTLSIMVGGPADVFERCLPVFQAMGQNIVHAGDENGLGQYVKLCNQTAGALNLLAMAEAVALGKKAGLDLNKMLEAITKGAAGSWMLSNLAPRVVNGDWEPGFIVRLQQKDLRLTLEAAAELNLPMPGVSLAHQMFRVVEAAGFGEKGTQSIIHALERLGSFKVHED